ncbi:hypothetical protein D3C86_1785660 [compost metagenome]
MMFVVSIKMRRAIFGWVPLEGFLSLMLKMVLFKPTIIRPQFLTALVRILYVVFIAISKMECGWVPFMVE